MPHLLPFSFSLNLCPNASQPFVLLPSTLSPPTSFCQFSFVRVINTLIAIAFRRTLACLADYVREMAVFRLRDERKFHCAIDNHTLEIIYAGWTRICSIIIRIFLWKHVLHNVISPFVNCSTRLLGNKKKKKERYNYKIELTLINYF